MTDNTDIQVIPFSILPVETFPTEIWLYILKDLLHFHGIPESFRLREVSKTWNEQILIMIYEKLRTMIENTQIKIDVESHFNEGSTIRRNIFYTELSPSIDFSNNAFQFELDYTMIVSNKEEIHANLIYNDNLNPSIRSFKSIVKRIENFSNNDDIQNLGCSLILHSHHRNLSRNLCIKGLKIRAAEFVKIVAIENTGRKVGFTYT
ncbi:1839_t:CDS:2 [Funneliformis mosseae]|uniref:1839_t:CDS:1 n=1 Tax=Funneliformis mosseae TaxID=27381 RepID=A0A9N8Z571_FUNMO|nr:1839_t:CDS:2 [Funneliformis mosseae]